ncbi:MAG: lysozyme inhibitor LprI family protein [Sphingosinicella sp.]|uniref:lysozyme inhibitor LprI family protein n=1 Tax=Sphingosinicella sp. TaxID=1917971 RepID=UPI00403837ED
MIIVLLSLLVSAQEPPLDCRDPQTQQDMNGCAARDFEQADRALNETWPRVLAYVRGQDEDMDDGRPSGESRLREAQRAWIAFRDAHCTVDSYAMRGGSAEPLLYNGCRARITEARTAQLRALILDQ